MKHNPNCGTTAMEDCDCANLLPQAPRPSPMLLGSLKRCEELSAENEALRAALDWYAEMAKLMQRATLHVDSQYMLGLMKQLAIDGGKKAREAMRPNGQVQGDRTK